MIGDREEPCQHCGQLTWCLIFDPAKQKYLCGHCRPQLIEENGKLAFTKENFDKLLKFSDSSREALDSIVNGCVHPEVAVRAMCVDLAPIRKALKRYKELFPLDLPTEVGIVAAK